MPWVFSYRVLLHYFKQTLIMHPNDFYQFYKKINTKSEDTLKVRLKIPKLLSTNLSFSLQLLHSKNTQNICVILSKRKIAK